MCVCVFCVFVRVCARSRLRAVSEPGVGKAVQGARGSQSQSPASGWFLDVRKIPSLPRLRPGRLRSGRRRAPRASPAGDAAAGGPCKFSEGHLQSRRVEGRGCGSGRPGRPLRARGRLGERSGRGGIFRRGWLLATGPGSSRPFQIPEDGSGPRKLNSRASCLHRVNNAVGLSQPVLPVPKGLAF